MSKRQWQLGTRDFTGRAPRDTSQPGTSCSIKAEKSYPHASSQNTLRNPQTPGHLCIQPHGSPSVGSTPGDTSPFKAAPSRTLLRRLLTRGTQHNRGLTGVLNRTHSLAPLYVQKLFCDSRSEVDSRLCRYYFLAAVHESFAVN